MYMLQEVLRVAPGREAEAVERLAWIHGLMQPNPGFVRAQVAHSLDGGADHLILRVWDSLQAFQAFRRTDDGQNYSKNRPAGLYDGLPVGRGWELLDGAKGDGKGSFMVRHVYKANPVTGDLAAVTSFEAWRCLDETPEHAGSFLTLARFAGKDVRDLWLKRQDASSISTDLYELVHDTRP